MKCGLAILITLFGIFYSGCRREERPGAVANANDAASFRAENRTVVKSSGWQLPVSLPEGRQYHATTVVIEGRGRVEVLNSPYFPPEEVVVRTPKFWDSGEAEYKVTQILEFTDSRRKPYCYQLFVRDERTDPDNIRAPSFFSYRDDDGDGVFETLGEACKVPDWVN